MAKERPPIDPALWQAYRETRFEVDAAPATSGGPSAPGFTIRVGERSPALDRLLDETGHDAWAFVTAANPASRPLSAEENAARNRRLERALRDRGLEYRAGRGVGADPDWAPEESFLVLGLDRSAAAALGAAFGQNAVVVGLRGEAASLLDCRDASD